MPKNREKKSQAKIINLLVIHFSWNNFLHTDEPVEVGVGWPVNVQITTTDVVDGLVVYHEGAVGVLQRRVRRQDGVVGLHHSSRHLHNDSTNK